MQTCVIILRILLNILQGIFVVDFRDKATVQSFVSLEFENCVSAAITSTMVLAGHEQVVAEFTLLQLWTRANKVSYVPCVLFACVSL